MKKGLLLGAGFSYDLGMPLAHELTNVFLGIFHKHNAKKLIKTLSSRSPYTEDRPINQKAISEGIYLLLKYKNNNASNYEDFLTEIQNIGKKPGKTQSDRDSYNYLFSFCYEIIHQILTLYQIESYRILYAQNLIWYSNLQNLLSEKETWVFTLNHDMYMECLAADLNIPITYGDENNISFPLSNIKMKEIIKFSCSERDSLNIGSVGFFKEEKGINLIKVHGGLSELEYKDGKIICNQILQKPNSPELISDFIKINGMAFYHQGKRVPSGKDRVITNPNGEQDIISKSMLTGGEKYSKTTNIKNGEEKLKILDDVLKELDELTIIGYGFGDIHVNNRISNAMALNEKLKLRIVDPINKPKPNILQQFDYDSRVVGAQCSAPIWIDYSGTQKWNKEQIDSLKKNESYRNEIKSNVENILKGFVA